MAHFSTAPSPKIGVDIIQLFDGFPAPSTKGAGVGRSGYDPMPIIIDTLGACLDDNYEIALYCYARHGGAGCNWSKWLDLEKLAAKLGRDQSIMHDDLVPKLYCLRCGSRDVGLRLSPPTVPGG